MSQYFPKPFRNFGENINDKVDYATKADVKIFQTLIFQVLR